MVKSLTIAGIKIDSIRSLDLYGEDRGYLNPAD